MDTCPVNEPRLSSLKVNFSDARHAVVQSFLISIKNPLHDPPRSYPPDGNIYEISKKFTIGE